jgi:hypothetical protein
MVTVEAMMPGALPPMGIPTLVAILRVMLKIWSGLGTQGVKGQDKAHRQDNTQPSMQVHSLTLRKNFCQQDLLIRKRGAGKR